jgi:4'-phosphopantetheinyl transferase
VFELNPASWPAGPERVSPETGRVDVWRIPLQMSSEEFYLSLLDTDEHARRERLATPALRKRFTVAHGALRSIIARYIEIAPNELELVRRPCSFCGQPHGKPVVASNHQSGVGFSFTRSCGWALVAVAATTDVGVDVEYSAIVIDANALASVAFTGAERSLVLGAPEACRRSVFLSQWTRKEACVKACGTSLALESPPNLMTLRLKAAMSDVATSVRHEKWVLWDIRPARSYQGALVVRECDALRTWTLQHPR